MVPPTLTYKDTRLVPMRSEDQELVLAWRSNPELSKYMYTDISKPQLSQQLKWFENVKDRPDFAYWMIHFNDKPVGVVNLAKLEPEHKRTDWAFYLGASDTRGKGIGSKVETAIIYYVFYVLGLEKLHCQVFSTNQSVIALHEKFGFKVEGVLRNHFLRGDAWNDLVLLSLFKSEAEARNYKNEDVKIN